MPQEITGVIYIEPGQVVLVQARPAVEAQLTPTQERITLLDQIGQHFCAHAESIGYSRSRNISDLEQLRTDLAPGLEDIIPEVERLNISDREIEISIREALKGDRIDPILFESTFRSYATAYINEIRSYPPFNKPQRAA